MTIIRKIMLALGLAAVGLLTGCTNTPAEYNWHRPAVEDIDARDRGLQSADVISATDRLTMELLANPLISQNPRKLTIVFDRLEDHSRSHQFNYDIFLERMKTNIARQAPGKIAIISNRDKFYSIRNRELDGAGGGRVKDEYGQGDGAGTAPPPAGRIQPDYALTGKVMEVRNHGTSYYHFTFSLVDINAEQRGIEPITLGWEVKVAR